MKIAHVIHGFFPQSTGGTQMQLRDLCREQRHLGHHVHVFTRLAGHEHDEFELSVSDWEGVPVTRLTYNYLDFDRFELSYTHPLIDKRFEEFLSSFQPQVVHVHHLSSLSTSLVEVAKRRGIPVVMWVSDYWLVCPRGQRIHPDDLSICEELDRDRCLPCIRRLWPHVFPEIGSGEESSPPEALNESLRKIRRWEDHIRGIIDLCDAILSPSVFHRARFLEAGAPADRCHVVTYGLPRNDLLAPPRGNQPIRSIGYIGSLIPSKGVHILVEAFNLIKRRDLVLNIHGEIIPFHGKTNYFEELKSMIRPGLSVQFHGRYEIHGLPGILRALDLLVIPSIWWESYCLTAREGALAGLPVIVSRLAGLEEAVDSGLALGFEPGNAEELAEVIELLLQDSELRAEMSRKAHLVTDISECAAKIDQIYKTVTGP